MTTDGVIEIGWLLDRIKGGFIWQAPRALQAQNLQDRPAAATGSGPALLESEPRIYEVPCPIDAKFSASIQANGEMRFRNELGKASPIITEFLQKLIVTMPPDHWRQPDRPVIQLVTPYRFVTDDYCFLEMLPPYHDYKAGRWPGLMFGGRFQADVWPRRLMWAFEWFDLSRPLELKRGEPWFYVRFEGADPAGGSVLGEADWTPELERYVDGIETVTNYVGQTLSLFKTAQERRPRSLLKRMRR